MLTSRVDYPGITGAMSSIDLVIFDCDGVLIDSEPIASRTLAETLQGAGIAITAAEAHAKFTGNSESIIAEMCRREYGIIDVAALFEAWHRHLFEEFARSLTPIPGISEVVKSLDRPKCVASNSTMRRLRNSLGKLDLWSAFAEGVFSAEFVSRPKPAPDLLLHCAERFRARPARCVMIDDSVHGVAAAIAAGMTAIGFVDPADPRPGRRAVLDAAGAAAVATGAGELTAILEHVGGRL
ncbi:HAD-IA family hydrolase [Rhizobium lentis]|uniref:HAD family hydrolase n=1 Tax=Rhizobium lentis TaxID=1138194 RepID=UPI001A91F817|nr:HAD-IA family hydrolase [Rhizobium lentis]MBX4997380.1 HAD-IA family hydrolase [Rhizobium lentis]MBX5015045.1 HAD-IA family hydrolase [Rhizobium lentis]MBX5039750.1 HAD-IA family hydrolase [Rhizobium lentis]MBX5064216.1 HAD-IA family hydrolase [Rhizobium lentis]MBX5069375.1 HAD-IA family hydrolase [Rhizobium lentis]